MKLKIKEDKRSANCETTTVTGNLYRATKNKKSPKKET